jgi:hypothetical protein
VLRQIREEIERIWSGPVQVFNEQEHWAFERKRKERIANRLKKSGTFAIDGKLRRRVNRG